MRRMNHEAGRAVRGAPQGWKAWLWWYDDAGRLTRPAWLAGRPVGLLLAALAVVGCQSPAFSSYLSPRVTGRVLAADTRQPLAEVRIKRVNPAGHQDFDDAAKGGQRLDSTGGAWTDSQGRFVLDAERDLTLLSQQTWVAVTLSFEHDGYLTLRTNYTLANVTTNAPDGAPVVAAGDILLRPASP